MAARSIFITGTDTGVGKTFVTTALLRSLRADSIDAVGFKPIECGIDHGDSQAIWEASGGADVVPELSLINPIHLDKPLAPVAAVDDPETLDLDPIFAAYEQLAERHELVLIEGAGGWLVPVAADRTMADIAAELTDEIIMVAANRLGVLNHVMLTYSSIYDYQIACNAIVLNDLPTTDSEIDLAKATNFDTLETCMPGVPIYHTSSEADVAAVRRSVTE